MNPLLRVKRDAAKKRKLSSKRVAPKNNWEQLSRKVHRRGITRAKHWRRVMRCGWRQHAALYELRKDHNAAIESESIFACVMSLFGGFSVVTELKGFCSAIQGLCEAERWLLTIPERRVPQHAAIT
jgi:hypothetical protein